MTGLIIDSFAGGGGASAGIQMALGRSPDFAINHDAQALAMHIANHPLTTHFCESVWRVDPVEMTRGHHIDLAWFSPDCRHFSKAKGGKPRDTGSRGLAWVVTRWAKLTRPRVIILENVEEFKSWGPLLIDGTPNPEKKGNTFTAWTKKLERYGYKVEWRNLRACDYGAPTTRKRLFVIARCDGLPIVWPEPTHGPGLEPFRTAGECIDWSVPAPSIFERKKPLADATCRRIARGIMKFAVNHPEPFIAPVTHQGDSRVHSLHEPMRTVTGANRGEFTLVVPTLIQTSYGERKGQLPRVLDFNKPLGTVVAGGIKHAVVHAFLSRYAKDDCRVGHAPEVRAFLTKFYTNGGPGSHLNDPMATLTTKDRMGLVTVSGADYQIADIGLRMLTPRELFRAQGFPDDYVIAPDVDGKPLTKTAQIRMVGNSVCPPIAAALVDANVRVSSSFGWALESGDKQLALKRRW